MSRFYIENGEILDCGFFLGSKEQYVDIMNKQDQRIVELEEQLAKEQKHISRLKNMNKSHDETVGRLTEENNQLKYQLEEKDKEIEKLKITKNNAIECADLFKVALSVRQKDLAIQELEKLKASADKWFESWENSKYEGNIYDKLDVSNAYLQMSCEIDQQIKELKGEK